MGLIKTHQKFTELFGFKFPIDGMISMLNDKPKIDLVKFDEWLRKEHGEYDINGCSIREIINNKYGIEAVKFIQELI